MSRHVLTAFAIGTGIILYISYVGTSVPVQLECGPTASLRVCTARCGSHSECPAPLLCCPTKCGGAACLPGVTARNNIERNAVDRGPANKRGQCREPSGSWICSDSCRDDSDCTGSKKCCPGRCGGLSCVPPA